MPGFMKILMTVGTAAMLWVGGSIVVHGAAELGWHWPEEVIHHLAEAVAHAVGTAEGAVAWLVKAVIDGLLGLAIGLALIPLSARIFAPVAGLFTRKA
jgi:predicted DNA repair protein MutK